MPAQELGHAGYLQPAHPKLTVGAGHTRDAILHLECAYVTSTGFATAVRGRGPLIRGSMLLLAALPAYTEDEQTDLHCLVVLINP